MKKVHRSQTKSPYMIYLTGILVALTVSVASLALLSALYLNSSLEVKSSVFFIAAIQLVSVLLGGFIAGKQKGEKYILSVLIVCGGYYLTLTASTLLVFDRSFQRMGIGSIMCALGAGLACILCLIQTSRSVHKKHRL